MQRFFVTGTGTGVGKTTVAVALLEQAKSAGFSSLALKPAESGCERDELGSLVAVDAQRLSEAMTDDRGVEGICRFRYEAAIAPGVAARETGRGWELEALARFVEAAGESEPDLVLVEGAGGLMVPLGVDCSVMDAVVRLGLPVIVVGVDGLGTINHSVLTVEALRRRKVEVAGVILSGADGSTETGFVESNADEIERLSGQRVLGWLPYGSAVVQELGGRGPVLARLGLG